MFDSSPYRPVATSQDGSQQDAARGVFVDAEHPVEGVMQGIVNLRLLTQEQRCGLLRGQKIDVYMGQNLVAEQVPKRVLMATSETANKFFHDHPTAKEFTIPAGCAEKDAVRAVLRDAVSEQSLAGEQLYRELSDGTFSEALKILGAANALGMRAHAWSMMWYFCQKLNNAEFLPSYEELDVLVAFVPPSDKVFQRIASILANRRRKEMISNLEAFAHFLEQHHVLAQAMDEADAEEQTRVERNDAERRKYEDVVEKARYANRVFALKEKLAKSKDDVMSLSTEEAELRLELGL